MPGDSVPALRPTPTLEPSDQNHNPNVNAQLLPINDVVSLHVREAHLEHGLLNIININNYNNDNRL